MVAKQCPYCGQVSYSASDREGWICPYCKQDISNVAAEAKG